MFRPTVMATSLAMACLFTPVSGLAADIGWSGSLGFSLKNYNRDVSTTGGISYDGTITDPADGPVLDTLSYQFVPTMAVGADATLPMLTAQGVMTLDKWYFLLKLENSLRDTSVDYDVDDDYSADMSRMDSSLVAGYRMDNGWSVFGGLLKAETEETGDVVFASGDMSSIDATLDVDGLLLGTSYSWSMAMAACRSVVRSLALTLRVTNSISMVPTWGYRWPQMQKITLKPQQKGHRRGGLAVRPTDTRADTFGDDGRAQPAMSNEITLRTATPRSNPASRGDHVTASAPRPGSDGHAHG